MGQENFCSILEYGGKYMIAEVIINRAAKKLNKGFDYKIPKKLEEIISVGSKVLVPFGNGKKLEEGFVIRLKPDTNYEFEVKEINSLEDNLKEEQINLAKWMAKRYFCNVSDCIKLMLTPGTRTKEKEKRVQDKTIEVILLNTKLEKEKIGSKRQLEILSFVEKNEGLTIPELEKQLNTSRATINNLVEKGYLRKVKQKIERNPLDGKDINRILMTESAKKLTLTGEQQEAYQKINDSITKNIYNSFLLFGVTGSRKNRSLFTVN